jgi:hypothetical protein
MRYATWEINFNDNANEGTTPELFLLPKSEGAFYVNQNKIAGYILDNQPIENVEKWSVVEITANEFLELAKLLNPDASFDESGKLFATDPYLIF